VGDGRWICASYHNPTIEDLLTGTSGRYSGEPVAVMGNTLQQARQTYGEATVLKRADCDPYQGRWICASFDNPDMVDLTHHDSSADTNQPASTVAAGTGAVTPPATDSTTALEAILQTQLTTTIADIQAPLTTEYGNALPDNSLYQYGDLISLNYDSCPDPDDQHAAVAAKMVLDFYGLENGEDYIITNGTCGDLRPRSDYITDSYHVFDELYFLYWNDAFRDENFSISLVGDQYIQRLEAGQKVWVLDGGPMDFTARVIAYIQGVGTSADLENITVVQHSHGWNEQHTDPANLAYMEQHARYLKIDDGNHQANRTPQLNQSNQQAAFPDVDPALVERFASDPRYSRAWELAFEQLSTKNRFDGSDTVELLWVLGLGSREIANWYDFADRYIPDTRVQGDTAVPVSLADAAVPVSLADAAVPVRLTDRTAPLSLADTNVPLSPADTTAPLSLADTTGPISLSDTTSADVVADNSATAKDPAPTSTINTPGSSPVADVVTRPASDLSLALAAIPDPGLVNAPSSHSVPDASPFSGSTTESPSLYSTPGYEFSNSTLRLEAESAVLGAGWVRETVRSGFSGTGYIRWSEGNLYRAGGEGITQYIVIPEVSGVHQVKIRARAINPPQSDLNNDVWIRMNGEQAEGSSDLTDWVKVFTTGQDSWQLGGTADKAHSMELFKQELIAGRLYTLEISGRSTNYAIDYLEVSPVD